MNQINSLIRQKAKLHLVGNSPVSGFYFGFYFVPSYALEHMYYGVSEKAYYFAFRDLLSGNSWFFEKNYLYAFKGFYPKPDLYISKKFSDTWLLGYLRAEKNFFFLRPRTPLYDFVVGFFLWVIWQLGGGVRFSPLYDSEKKFGSLGFHTLKFTPLAVIFKFYLKISYFFGTLNYENFNDCYFFNPYSLKRGFLKPNEFRITENYSEGMVNFWRNFLIPFIIFIFEFSVSFIFHIFFRNLCSRYIAIRGHNPDPQKPDHCFYDSLWFFYYIKYIEEVCALLRLTNKDYESVLTLTGNWGVPSQFFATQRSYFLKKKELYKLHRKSEFGVQEFKFSESNAKILYAEREYDKISEFKKIILQDALAINEVAEPSSKPKRGWILELDSKRAIRLPYNPNYWGLKPLHWLRSYPIDSAMKSSKLGIYYQGPDDDEDEGEEEGEEGEEEDEDEGEEEGADGEYYAPPLDSDDIYDSGFKHNVYQAKKTKFYSEHSHYFFQIIKNSTLPGHEKEWAYRKHYRMVSFIFFQLSKLWPTRFYTFISFWQNFLEFNLNLLRFIFVGFGFCWFWFKSLNVFRGFIYYFSVNIRPYWEVFIKTQPLYNYPWIFRFRAFFFYNKQNLTEFNNYQKNLIAYLEFYKKIYFFTVKLFSKIKQLYVFTFWIIVRPILTIIYFIYLEIRFIAVFVVESVRYKKELFKKRYQYSILIDYYTIFRKFFIGAKFFRFFTREIGEDLEDTPYNNPEQFRDDLSDYLSDFPAYEDMQKSFTGYQQGYADVMDSNEDYVAHYFDYWYSPHIEHENELPMKPNLEFFAETYFEAENDLFSQLFCIWISPILFDFKETLTTPPPYSEKDVYDSVDNIIATPGDWFPLELSIPDDDEEEKPEFETHTGTDVIEVTAESNFILPFDSDRIRLIKFAKKYKKKLDRWHTYQINNNFYKIPDALRYLPVSNLNLPKNFSDWQVATKEVSNFFFSTKQKKKYRFTFNNYQDLEKVWSRIGYELDRNPKKIYDFLDDPRISKVFDKFSFVEPPKKSYINFFSNNFIIFRTNRHEPDISFCKYICDYFSGRADISHIEKNRNFSTRNPQTVFFVVSYMHKIANYDHQTFIKKYWVISQFSQFSEIKRAFEFYTKHKSKSTENIFFPRSRDKFLEEFNRAYAVTTLKYRGEYIKTDFFEYIKSPKQFLSYITPNFFKRKFFQFYKAHKLENITVPVRVQNIIERGEKVDLSNYSQNVNGNWYQRLIDKAYKTFSSLKTSRWQLKILPNRSIYASSNQWKPTFEGSFSVFLLDQFRVIKKAIRRKKHKFKSYIFREYGPGGIFFHYTDGEDYDSIEDSDYRRELNRGRAAFQPDQAIEGGIWSLLNPALDELFYEIYYLNGNIFSPSAFEDHLHLDFMPDDHTDSGLDIYDEYIFVGGENWVDKTDADGNEYSSGFKGEMSDEDPDSMEYLDLGEIDDQFEDEIEDVFNDGVADEELGSEVPDHYFERFWHNNDWFMLNEISNSDEGLEDWEPDEFDTTYDLDHSIDRLFFGALKRKNHFPATDPRVFIGTLWENKNLDKDLDYRSNFELAKSNNESKDVVPVGIQIEYADKKFFSSTKFFFLFFCRIFLYVVLTLRTSIDTIFFSNFDNPRYFKLLKARAHYVKWYQEYNSFHFYKSRLDDWLEFFEKFKEHDNFKNYKLLKEKFIIFEPQTGSFLKDPYGRFWFQYPFNTYLGEYVKYSNGNKMETFYLTEDLLNSKIWNFRVKDGSVDFYNFNRHEIADEIGDTPTREFDRFFEEFDSVYHNIYRFFTSDITLNATYNRNRTKKRIKRWSSYPWFSDRTRIETVGSDFTYLDLIFVDDLPEDIAIMDQDDPEPEHDHWLDYEFSKNRYGARYGDYLPEKGALTGLMLEETDWDIGSLTSFSSDDFHNHLDDFSEKYDLYFAAINDAFDLLKDYTIYFFYSKARKYVLTPYRYWEVVSNSTWLLLASRYGIWVLVLRNFFNLSLFFVLSIYGFFTITRVTYFSFGETFNFTINAFIVFFSSVIYFVFLLRFLFKSANDFYKGVSFEEKSAIFASLLVLFLVFNTHGYVKNPAYYTWSSRLAADKRRLLSNNYSLGFRTSASDWYQSTGFTHRPELGGRQGWVFYKGRFVRTRYGRDSQDNDLFIKHTQPDRQSFSYNFGIASYPTYLNPYNLYKFVKFHLFQSKNTNFIGYRKFRRTKEKNTRRVNTKNVHRVLHRPEKVNWLHLTEPEAEKEAKEDLLDQIALLARMPNYYNRRGLVRERKKNKNIEFVNPINQTPGRAIYSPKGKPRSRLPYDFRQKKVSEPYFRDQSVFNSRVHANVVKTGFNKNFAKVDPVPSLFRPDAENYKTRRKALGPHFENTRSRKYTKSAYKLFDKKGVNDTGIVEKAIRVNWIQRKIYSKHFTYLYADQLRKYLFLYNPKKAKPIRDLYGLAIKDVVPYAEVFKVGQKSYNLFSSDFFEGLDNVQRSNYVSLLEAEALESANLLLINSIRLPKKSLPHKFYFDCPDNHGKFKLSADLYKVYEGRYARKVRRYFTRNREAYRISSPIGLGYETAKLNFLYDAYAKVIRNSVISYRTTKIQELQNFFSDYLDYKTNQFTSEEHNDLYISKFAHVNIIRRNKLLTNYFQSIKSVNKQAMSDYYRDSIRTINPYNQKAFYIQSAFKGYLSGILADSNYEKSVFDPFYSHPAKSLSYESSGDDRISAINANLEFKKPIYDFEKRSNARSKRFSFIDSRILRYTYDNYEFWVLEPTSWDIFLDFIMYKDIFLDAETFHTEQMDTAFPYKFDNLTYNYRGRKHLVRKSKTNPVRLNTITNKNFTVSDVNYLESALNEPETIKNDHLGVWEGEFDQDPMLDEVPRYKFSERIGGVEEPLIKAGRFDFRRPHQHFESRFDIWSELEKTSMRLERHRKPYFGVGQKDEITMYKQRAKRRSYQWVRHPILYYNNLLGTYNWLNIIQRSKILYGKSGSTISFPYNQKFIKLFALTRPEISQHLDVFIPLVHSREWVRSRESYTIKYPVNMLDVGLSGKKINKKVKVMVKKFPPEEDFDYVETPAEREKKLQMEKLLYAKRKVEFMRQFLASKKRYDDSEENDEFTEDTDLLYDVFEDAEVNSIFSPDVEIELDEDDIDPDEKKDQALAVNLEPDHEKGIADMIYTRAKKRAKVVERRKNKLDDDGRNG